MDFKEFCDQLDSGEIAMCSDQELIRYSRSDLKSKENLVEIIAYPDNMIDDWYKFIGSLLQVPCVWILHDRDDCDPHVHIIIQWSNNVQLSYFLKYFNKLLAKSGINPKTHKEYCPAKLIQPVKYPERAYEYLIHNTEDSKDKYQYSPLERHCENGFDIHFAKQLDNKKKYLISKAISDHIVKYEVKDLVSMYAWIESQSEDYYLCYMAHSGFFDRLCAGNWKKWERDKAKKIIKT